MKAFSAHRLGIRLNTRIVYAGSCIFSLFVIALLAPYIAGYEINERSTTFQPPSLGGNELSIRFSDTADPQIKKVAIEKIEFLTKRKSDRNRVKSFFLEDASQPISTGSNRPGYTKLFYISHIYDSAEIKLTFSSGDSLRALMSGLEVYLNGKRLPLSRGYTRIEEAARSISIDIPNKRFHQIFRRSKDREGKELIVEAKGRLLGRHLMGTDKIGRDVFSRVIFGTRTALLVGLVSMGVSVVFGVILGSFAGYYGGVIDIIIMRGTDVVASFPRFLLVLAAMAIVPESVVSSRAKIVLVLGLTGWVRTARLVRNQFLSLKEQEFIVAARAIGGNDRNIIMRHLLPNCLSHIIVASAYGAGYAIILEAGLSFLGFGISRDIPSWGGMLRDGYSAYLMGAYWISIFPGIAIVFTILGFNFLGDGIEQAIDPHRKYMLE